MSRFAALLMIAAAPALPAAEPPVQFRTDVIAALSRAGFPPRQVIKEGHVYGKQGKPADD